MCGFSLVFRNQAFSMGSDVANFMMGHRIGGGAKGMNADDHYFSREDVEAKRELYRKNMANLALESSSPNELEQITEAQADELRTLKSEMLNMKEQISSLIEEVKALRDKKA
jgi:hypothetical protein